MNLSSLDEGQRWVVFVVLALLTVLRDCKPLRRLLGYMLAHSVMGRAAA